MNNFINPWTGSENKNWSTMEHNQNSKYVLETRRESRRVSDKKLKTIESIYETKVGISTLNAIQHQ